MSDDYECPVCRLPGSDHEEVHKENERLRQERDLAIAHDTQPYPTAWAYEQVCKALEDHKQQLAAVNNALPDFVQADGTPPARIAQLETMWRTAVQQLAAVTSERDEAMEALGYPMPYDPSARCGKIVCGLCGPREQQLAAMTTERDALYNQLHVYQTVYGGEVEPLAPTGPQHRHTWVEGRCSECGQSNKAVQF